MAPQGDEVDQTHFIEAPSVPQAGSYISLMLGSTTHALVVQRIWWEMRVSKEGDLGVAEEVAVECLPATNVEQHQYLSLIAPNRSP